MLLFSGSSNQPLAEKIAEELKISLAACETVRFADGEVRVRMVENVKDQVCAVLQSLSPPVDSNLMELCQFGQLLKKAGAKKIVAVVPYLGYARQDKAHREGEAVSSAIVAKIIETFGFTDVITLDLHSVEVVNFYKIPTLSLSALETFAQFIDSHRDDFGGGDLVIAAPDEGARNKAEELAKILEVDWAIFKKERDLEKPDEIKPKMTGQGEIKGKEVIIIDDIVSTGGTAITCSQKCLGMGAFHVFLMATHAVFTRGEPQFWQNSPLEKIYISDSILVPKTKMFDKLEFISVAPLLAKNLLNFL